MRIVQYKQLIVHNTIIGNRRLTLSLFDHRKMRCDLLGCKKYSTLRRAFHGCGSGTGHPFTYNAFCLISAVSLLSDLQIHIVPKA